MNNAPLARWLEYLETLHPNPMDLGLERVGRVARALQLLPVSVPVVTVAGTNGKGTTVAVLESLLTECGRCAGAFTSPHLTRFNERIRVARAEVDDASIVAAFEAIEAARGETTLTYFEFSALAALWIFRERAVDTAILEVGLGGRLDATNIVDADLAVITSIDLDHQQWLGDSRGTIAREKAGIAREGRPVIVADPEPPVQLLDALREIGAGPVECIGRDFALQRDGRRWRARLRGVDGTPWVSPPWEDANLLPQNIAAALQAALGLGVEFAAGELRRALAAVALRGRRQRLDSGGLHYLLDVAHNPAATARLLENVDAGHCSGRRIALFSAMRDKAVAEMLAQCRGFFDAWVLADQPDNSRAMPAAEVAALLRDLGVVEVAQCADLPQALEHARRCATGADLVVVFGSFYTVAGVLPFLEAEQGSVGLDE